MKPRVLKPKYIEFIRSGLLKKEDFVPQYINEKWCKPKYSLREQADIRKACTLLGMDVNAIGLPVKQKKELRKEVPEGTKYQKNFETRKNKVDSALNNMQKTINKWKQEKEKEDNAKISNLPF